MLDHNQRLPVKPHITIILFCDVIQTFSKALNAHDNLPPPSGGGGGILKDLDARSLRADDN